MGYMKKLVNLKTDVLPRCSPFLIFLLFSHFELEDNLEDLFEQKVFFM